MIQSSAAQPKSENLVARSFWGYILGLTLTECRWNIITASPKVHYLSIFSKAFFFLSEVIKAHFTVFRDRTWNKLRHNIFHLSKFFVNEHALYLQPQINHHCTLIRELDSAMSKDSCRYRVLLSFVITAKFNNLLDLMQISLC